MWFATHDGLMRFDGHTFKTYRGGNSPKNVPHSYISSLALDKNNNLWIGTKAGLCLYHPKSNNFERIDSIFGKPLQGHRWVKDIYVDCKGRLWVDRKNGTLKIVLILKQEPLKPFSMNTKIMRHIISMPLMSLAMGLSWAAVQLYLPGFPAIPIGGIPSQRNTKQSITEKFLPVQQQIFTTMVPTIYG